MHIKRHGLGWPFYVAVFALFAATFVLLDPTFDRNPLGKIKKSFRTAAVKTLGLVGNDELPVWQTVSRAAATFADGTFPAQIKTLHLDIKYKHLDKIKADRARAIALGLLHNPQTVPAELTHGGKTYPVRLRLKGDLMDHWEAPERWSFRITMRNGETLSGFKKFSLQKPSSRQLPWDQAFQRMMRDMGNLAPRHEFYRVIVNGDHWGIMNAEEHLSKALVEFGGRKDGPLIEFGGQHGWYFEYANRGTETVGSFYNHFEVRGYEQKRAAKDKRWRRLLSYAVQAERAFARRRIAPEQFLDMDTFSRALIAVDAWNNPHTLGYDNTHYYLNPYTLRLEPITSDQGHIIPLEEKKGYWVKRGLQGVTRGFYAGVISAPRFMERFDANLDAVERNLKSVRVELDRVCRVFPIECPTIDIAQARQRLSALKAEARADYVALAARYANAYRPRSFNTAPVMPRPGVTLRGKAGKPKPFTGAIDYPAHIHADHYDNGDLVIHNLVRHQLTVTGVRMLCAKGQECDAKNLLSAPVVVPPTASTVNPLTATIALKPMKLSRDHRLEVTTKVGNQERQLTVSLSLIKDVGNPLLTEAVPDFIVVTSVGAHIPAGDWPVREPVVLPKGVSLTIAPGASLHFAPDAYMIVRGPVLAEGTPDRPITFAPTHETWGGLYVLETAARSKLSHVTIARTSSLVDGALELTGGVTFYRADVDIADVTFEGTKAEDALNIVKSDFTLTDVQFANTVSDAFDVDFSNGTLHGVTFTGIGGDGLDTSGARVNADDLAFDHVVDKAVSAGEGSVVSVDGITVNFAGSAVVAKDGSKLTVDGLVAKNVSLFAGMSYQKKSGYGAASLIVRNSNQNAELFARQKGHELMLNGISVAQRDLDVDALYASGPMKKVKASSEGNADALRN